MPQNPAKERKRISERLILGNPQALRGCGETRPSKPSCGVGRVPRRRSTRAAAPQLLPQAWDSGACRRARHGRRCDGRTLLGAPPRGLPFPRCGGLHTRGPSLGAQIGGCRRASLRRIYFSRPLSLSPSFPLRFSDDSYLKIMKSNKEGLRLPRRLYPRAA